MGSDYLPLLVGLTLYLLLTTEFLLRFYFQKPLRHIEPYSAVELARASSVEITQAGKVRTLETGSERVMTTQDGISRNMRLMVIGLVLATFFIVLRCVKSFHIPALILFLRD
jgi:hypothetical protein